MSLWYIVIGSSSVLSHSLCHFPFLCLEAVSLRLIFSLGFIVSLVLSQSHLPVTDFHQRYSSDSAGKWCSWWHSHLYHNSPACLTTFMPRNGIHSSALVAALLTFSSQRLTFLHTFDRQLLLFLDFEEMTHWGCANSMNEKLNSSTQVLKELHQ